jgi:hypothetical protein
MSMLSSSSARWLTHERPMSLKSIWAFGRMDFTSARMRRFQSRKRRFLCARCASASFGSFPAAAICFLHSGQ